LWGGYGPASVDLCQYGGHSSARIVRENIQTSGRLNVSDKS